MSRPQTVAERREQLKSQIGRVHLAAADDPCGGFSSPREFLAAVLRAGRPSAQMDDRLRIRIGTGAASKRVAVAGSDEMQTQGSAGFLVPSGLLPGFLANIAEDDPMASRVMKVEMPTQLAFLPARTDQNHTTSVAGGVMVTRWAETQPINTSLLQMRRICLEATGLWGAAFSTEELIVGSAMQFAAVLGAAFGDQMKATLINERLYGTGAGQFLGVLESGCLITVPPDEDQATATITTSNVVGMRSRCWGYNNAIWLANPDAYEQLATLALVGEDGAVTMLFMPSWDEGVPDMLCGRPLIFTEYCKTLGSVGDLVLGNWTQYLEGTLQSGMGDSAHVRFLNHERAFKFWMMNAAAPWWLVPLTPQNTSTTLSPFVTLQARP